MRKSSIYRCFAIATSLLCFTIGVQAQELACTVTVNADQIEGSNKSVFNTLQQAVSEYVNTMRWTNMTFTEQEKIECSMMIIVSAVSDNMFTAEFQVQSRRPVYGSSYTTTLLNFKDNYFNFTYQEYDRLEYQENVFTTNLTAMLAYYCYLIIGHDMDSFARLGGTPYFQQCENIVSAAQSASLESSEQTGWKAFDSNRNRYALINNLMDEAFKGYRNFFYEYHRLALDQMVNNVGNARARIAEGLPVLRDANRARPATYVINTFLDAKADELTDIFSKGTEAEKKAVYEVLMDIDPTRGNTYEKIKK
ncbi:MAG: DUF4835 family protein [Paludibacter sp.]|nr:DUF4835 family protein [Bacteroidales bacterium]MCM1069487.1 DUF4835 family protein [Prevotella sp.]MCM1354143.1 DUF4835 family protein [Bacteroides sp.]MCM1443000.1 DUF4835 family protein [Muribaculum sp.]MCM1482218.1 DUF4835 family protein [Paludibacter sp.]